jgi:N-acetylglucosamine-6-phosphate deacetylase
MRPLDRHEPGILGAALESDAFCEFICDGLHLHPSIIRLLVKAKGSIS